MSHADQFVSFAPRVVYRGLECPHLFNIQTDELYELDDGGLAFLDEADGSRRESEIKDRELLEFTRSENLLAFTSRPADGKLARGLAPVPSLRYLEVILTLRCNLRCRHCYLGEPQKKDLDPGLLVSALAEFDAMQGLRLLLSGGEPLLYPHWDKLAPALTGRGFRVVLLTNGALLTREKLRALPIHEVQISLDGLQPGHDALRGRDGFAKAMAAARLVVKNGMDLSIATMVHADNLDEMDGLQDLVKDLGAREWSLDFPLAAGRWDRASSSGVSLDEAAAAMARGYGASYHGAGEGFACGLHLASLTPGGDVCQCGFYLDSPLGNARDGLRNAWLNKRATPLSALSWCADCAAAEDCSGGCRYRASGPGPDPVMCAAHGWPKGRPPMRPR